MQQSSETTTPTLAATHSPAEPPKTKINIKPAPTTASSSENPFTTLTAHSDTPSSVRPIYAASSLKCSRAESEEQSTRKPPLRDTSADENLGGM